MDVTDRHTIDAARNFIKEKHGGLDVLLNNAGIAAVILSWNIDGWNIDGSLR